ncbi:MAG: type II toxin-antitoxin system prevent-host-death family antitoxin [Myxococcota bacterium]
MPTAGSREFRTRLGQYLDLVRKGETVVVTHRGRPIAKLHPIAPAHDDLNTRLAELAALGIVTLGNRRPLEDREPVRIRSGEGLSETILEEREDRC